jgi:pimeloyl-ACP methyl ester carboxylesterase
MGFYSMTRDPLLLLPGLTNTAEVWSRVMPLLSRTDLLAMELPHSEDLDDIARIVLREAPARFELAGFSLGGIVALAIAAIAPERITRLALVSSNAAADNDFIRSARQQLIDRAIAGQYAGITPRLTKLNQHPSTQNDATILALRDHIAAEYGADKFVAHSRALMVRPDRHDVLARLDIPVQLIVGREDLVTPLTASQAMLHAQPRAQLHIIEEAGHMVVLEKPEAVAAALRHAM